MQGRIKDLGKEGGGGLAALVSQPQSIAPIKQISYHFLSGGS
jgi:hypothetical protein